MIRISNATLLEKIVIKKVETAIFKYFNQPTIFMTDMDICSPDTIRELNNNSRGVDKVTDVLSFPCFEKMKLPTNFDDFCASNMDGKYVGLGSIVICRKKAHEQAEEYGHSNKREIGFLTCHGFLHLLGFDHIISEDEKVMNHHQKMIMDMINLKRD